MKLFGYFEIYFHLLDYFLIEFILFSISLLNFILIENNMKIIFCHILIKVTCFLVT